MATPPHITYRIKKVLLEVFQTDLHPSEIGDDQLLFGQSLPSLSDPLLELVSRLETEFDIKFRDEDLGSEFFVSVEAMAGVIKAILNNGCNRSELAY